MFGCRSGIVVEIFVGIVLGIVFSILVKFVVLGILIVLSNISWVIDSIKVFVVEIASGVIIVEGSMKVGGI